MEQKQRDIVYGYMRLTFGDSYPTDIVNVVYEYYLLRIASVILDSNEQMSLIDLLLRKLTDQSEDQEKIKSVDTKLLYRGSEHNFDCSKYHELCNNKGATISIIHNDKNHVFGVYANKSLGGDYSSEEAADPNAFMYMVRPKVNTYGFHKDRKDGKYAVWSSTRYGPTYGMGADIWIHDKCHERDDNGCQNAWSFDFDPKELSGAEINGSSAKFKVIEYEIFNVIVNT